MTTAPTDPTTRDYSLPELDAAGAGATAREIAQQPNLWREVGAAVAARRGETDAFLAPLLALPDLRVILTGAGTSAFAGELLASGLARRLGRRVDAVATTDLVSNPQDHLTHDVPTLMVSFARSGDSPESVAATRLADQHLTRCHHLVVTCNVDGQLYRDHVDAPSSLVLTMPSASNDHGFAMTSSFTCMLLTVLLTLRPPADDGDLVEQLADAGDQVLAGWTGPTRALAGRGHERIVYLGSGPLTALARESALKMLELTAGRVATWFDSSLGFRHGPKSVVNPRTLVVVYVSTHAHTRLYDLDIVTELRSLMPAADVIAVSTDVTGLPSDGQTWLVPAPSGADDLDVALLYVLFAQLLALHVSLGLGLTTDNPFPDNQVNRVVQGVTIHPHAGRP